ncbi:HNH endonuclease [Rhizobium sp. LEGMi198b]
MADFHLKASRIHAYNRQRGRCCYCGNPMWEAAIEPLDEAKKRFAEPRLEKWFKTPDALLESFRCTAEHCIARSDGGTDAPDNIVAACMLCNSTRMSMDVGAFRKKVRSTFFHMEAGHDRSVVDGQWRDNVAYDFRWHVTLFIEERDFWVEIFCQQDLPYVKFTKNHWHIKRNDSLVYPRFDGSLQKADLQQFYVDCEVIEGTRIMLENTSHETVLRKHFADKIYV